MKKNIGSQLALYPTPVTLIGAMNGDKPTWTLVAINACEELYKTMSFKEITMKEIGKATSFTRTSIHNYFQTKEEIFLALLKRENELWVADLTDMMNQ